MGGMLKLDIDQLNLPEEEFRIRIKELAEDTRIKFAKKGLCDIFDDLSEVSFLVRKPIEDNKISGFSIYFEDQFIVYLNSFFTLGHERFTAAHELYHIMYNADILKREKLPLDSEKFQEEDNKADVFASEFLMPEDYVKEIFFKMIKVGKNDILPRHIIIMHNRFKVSYKAMLKRLIQLDLCTKEKYDELAEICTLENKDQLQTLTQKEGYDISLITPSEAIYIPKEYIEFVKRNYENKKISYNNMKNCLEFVGLNPEQFGYEFPQEEDK